MNFYLSYDDFDLLKAIKKATGRITRKQAKKVYKDLPPGGVWRTIRGHHVYIKNGKMIAGATHFNGGATKLDEETHKEISKYVARKSKQAALNEMRTHVMENKASHEDLMRKFGHSDIHKEALQEHAKKQGLKIHEVADHWKNLKDAQQHDYQSRAKHIHDYHDWKHSLSSQEQKKLKADTKKHGVNQYVLYRRWRKKEQEPQKSPEQLEMEKRLQELQRQLEEHKRLVAELNKRLDEHRRKGNIQEVRTERGTRVKTRFKVVDARDLITSHMDNGQKNTAYPQELQPRDRSRATSEAQVEAMSNKLDPELLADSKKASDGAPIIGPDNVVESGNGRSMAIRRAYKQGKSSAERYKKYLLDNAEKFGLDPKEIEKVKHPVLVRERLTDVDRVQFTREANESGIGAMSMGEMAKVDAEKLKNSILDLYEGGDFRKKENASFVQAFYNNVVGQQDAGRFWTEGRFKEPVLSDEGEMRLRNALFAKAYGDHGLVNKLAEARDDSSVKLPLQALVDTAGQYARLKEDMKQGNLHDLDISKDLTSAIKLADDLRREGRKVDTFLSQGSLFGDDGLNKTQKLLLRFIDENKRNKKNVETFINEYISAVESFGHPDQGGLWGDFMKPETYDVVRSVMMRVPTGHTVLGRHDNND